MSHESTGGIPESFEDEKFLEPHESGSHFDKIESDFLSEVYRLRCKYRLAHVVVYISDTVKPDPEHEPMTDQIISSTVMGSIEVSKRMVEFAPLLMGMDE